MPQQYDEIPVLPEESTDLKTHVKQCTLRYQALIRLIGRVRLYVVVAAVMLFIDNKINWAVVKTLLP